MILRTLIVEDPNATDAVDLSHLHGYQNLSKGLQEFVTAYVKAVLEEGKSTNPPFRVYGVHPSWSTAGADVVSRSQRRRRRVRTGRSWSFETYNRTSTTGRSGAPGLPRFSLFPRLGLPSGYLC